MFKKLHEGLDALEAGVKSVSEKTIGELGTAIVDTVVDAGTAVKKKIDDTIKEL